MNNTDFDPFWSDQDWDRFAPSMPEFDTWEDLEATKQEMKQVAQDTWAGRKKMREQIEQQATAHSQRQTGRTTRMLEMAAEAYDNGHDVLDLGLSLGGLHPDNWIWSASRFMRNSRGMRGTQFFLDHTVQELLPASERSNLLNEISLIEEMSAPPAPEPFKLKSF
jgi:hypothetical protein